MRKPTYHQINPLIRLKETELLSEQQFQQLLEKYVKKYGLSTLFNRNF